MNSSKKIIFVIIPFFIFACNGNTEKELIDIDTTQIETFVDTIETVELNEEFVDTAGYTDSEVEVAEKIEKKYGVQWDFCDCIIKNDSIEKAIMSTDDDDQLTLILDRSEVIDNHCKELLTAPNTTPDERAKHERKVNKCLKEANRRNK